MEESKDLDRLRREGRASAVAMSVAFLVWRPSYKAAKYDIAAFTAFSIVKTAVGRKRTRMISSRLGAVLSKNSSTSAPNRRKAYPGTGMQIASRKGGGEAVSLYLRGTDRSIGGKNEGGSHFSDKFPLG